jgi:hypothetical protein
VEFGVRGANLILVGPQVSEDATSEGALAASLQSANHEGRLCFSLVRGEWCEGSVGPGGCVTRSKVNDIMCYMEDVDMDVQEEVM